VQKCFYRQNERFLLDQEMTNLPNDRSVATIEPTKQVYSRREIACLLLALTVHAGSLIYWASWHGPVSDEVGHMAAGLSHWRFARFELFAVNPPLVRLLATAPVFLSPHHENWRLYSQQIANRSEFNIGREFVSENPDTWLDLFFLARCMCIPFGTIAALLCFWWGRYLYGRLAGWIAMLLWCSSPTCMTYSAMMTPDAVATTIGVFAWWVVVQWLKSPTWGIAAIAGVFLGLAVLSKSTLAILVVILPVAAVAVRLSRRIETPVSHRSICYQTICIGCISLHVINTGYAFEGTFTRFGDFTFRSEALMSLQNVCGDGELGELLRNVPVPLPKNMLLGIDHLKYEYEQRYWSYLRGEHKLGGWWYYYLYAYLVKTPIGALGLLLVAFVTFTWRIHCNELWLDELLLLAPAFAVFLVVSSQTGFNHHIRYVLPAFPSLCIFASRVARTGKAAKRLSRIVCLFLTAWAVYSGLTIFPHSMSYFNELVGGPKNGWKHLSFSNIDWGQDMHFLRDWQRSHPQARPLYIRTKSLISAEKYGILSDQFPIEEDSRKKPFPAGWYVLGINELLTHNSDISGFLRLASDDQIGYSMNVYYLDSPQILESYFGSVDNQATVK